MDESRGLNAVIDVIMLAGTILLKSGSGHRVEDTMIVLPHCEINGLQFLPCPSAIFFLWKYQYFSDETGDLCHSYNIEKFAM